MKLGWWAWWHGRRTRPRRCQECGALIEQPADGLKDVAGLFCDRDCLNAYETEMQRW